MNSLEQLIKQEHKSKGLLVFYSISIPPPLSPEPCPAGPALSLDNLASYVDTINEQCGISSANIVAKVSSMPVGTKILNDVFSSEGASSYISNLNEQYGISSANIIAKIPSTPIQANIFNNKSLNEGVSPYISNLNEQYGISSANIVAKVSSMPVGTKILDDVFSSEGASSYISKLNEQFGVSSTSIKPADNPIYNPIEFKIPECDALKFDRQKIFSIQDPEPEKNFYNSFKKEHAINLCGLKNEKPVYDLFKRNEFANVYNKVTEGLKLRKETVKTITFTNPLKNEEDFSPSFTPYSKELRFPAIKPKKIPFDIMSQTDYNKMLNNAFLPHELGHAKVEEKYHKYPSLYSDELKGFNEHLADAWSLDSVKNTPQLFNTKTEHIKFEDTWVTPQNNISRARENYEDFITSKEDTSFIIGKQATVNMLGEPLLKQKYDQVLKEALDFKYGQDPYKHTVYESVNNLSNSYQESAIKIIELSKKDTILSNFKARRILSNIEKQTFRFKGDL